MNIKKITRLRFYAERTIKILDFIKEGKNSQEIVQAFATEGQGVDRQLVDYYLRQVK